MSKGGGEREGGGREGGKDRGRERMMEGERERGTGLGRGDYMAFELAAIQRLGC